MAPKGCAWIWSTGTRLFPLTPALSLGERENRPPLRGGSNALGRAGVSGLNRRAHGATENDARLEKPQDARSLSLRERARVRGNETQPTQTGERENASPTAEASLSFCRLSCGFISKGA